MKIIPSVAFGLFAAAASTFGTFGGCGDRAGPGAASAEDVIYEGGTNDEALDNLLAAELEDDLSEAPVIELPANGATLDPAAVATFRWRPDGELARALDPPEPVPAASQRKHPGAGGAWLFAGVPEAHAHGEPINGRAFLLELSTEADPEVVRVFTSLSEYTPSADVWRRVTAATAEITVTVTAAEFESNRIIQGGGPWRSSPVAVRVTGP